MNIHPVDLCREQRSLVSAGTGTDLDDNVLVIIRVFREKQDLEFMLQLFHTFSGIGKLFFQKLPHLFIRLFLQHGKAVLDCLVTFFVFFICFHNRSQIVLLFHQTAEPRLIIDNVRFLKLSHNLFKTNQQIVQFIKHLLIPPHFLLLYCTRRLLHGQALPDPFLHRSDCSRPLPSAF